MSEVFNPADDAPDLAAEYALGVLDADARREAETRERTDPAFGAEVAEWTQRLSPLLDQIHPVEPSAELWSRIESGLASAPGPSSVIEIAERRPAADAGRAAVERSRRLWRGAALTALAASTVLAVLLGVQTRRPAPTPQPSPAPAAPPPLMVAQLAAKRGPSPMVAAYDPARRAVLVSLPAGTAPAGRAPELWLIDASGKPLALGVLRSGDVSTLVLPEAVARRMKADVVLAISIEPPGGSPTGQPTGPVIAKGTLRVA